MTVPLSERPVSEIGASSSHGMDQSTTLSTSLSSLELGETMRSTITPHSKRTEQLLVYNLLDVDEETLYFWVKAITGLWPVSIHLSETAEKAVVKVPLIERGLGE